MADASTIQRAMIDSVAARDFVTLRALLHADYTYTASDGHPQKGADAGVAVAEMYTSAFPDIELTVLNQWSPAPDTAIMEFRAHGTHTGALGDIPPTGRTIEIIVCNIVETLDGQIIREREYFDGVAILTQLGVLPAAE